MEDPGRRLEPMRMQVTELTNLLKQELIHELTNLLFLKLSCVSVKVTNRFWLLNSVLSKLSTGVAFSQINSIVNDSPIFNPFALAKSFKPFPKLILPELSRRRFASLLVPSFPNRVTIPGLSMPFSFKNGNGRY